MRRREAEDVQSEEETSSAKFAIVSNELKQSFQKLMQREVHLRQFVKNLKRLIKKVVGEIKDFTKVVQKCLKNAKLIK